VIVPHGVTRLYSVAPLRRGAVLRGGARRRDALRADAPARVRVGMTGLAIVEDAASL